MEAIFTEQGRKDFLALEKSLQKFFQDHINKLAAMPPRRHMKFGVPYHVEDVTRQARLVYEIEGETMFITHCFATHKEYEKWYNSFR